ncbi:MAG: ATP synthase subunit I [Acidobacteria bacterium]|nr:ATP synthase subunit I [Acidobacteriota bacterium]
MPTVADPIGTATERRIAWLTPTIGVGAAVITAFAGRRDWGAGIAVGSILAWFNFRWLRQGMDAVAAAANAQSGATKTHVPIGTYFRALFRYALIALCLYVIFKVSAIPLVSMVFGLFALGAAAMAASVYELWRPTTTESHEEK